MKSWLQCAVSLVSVAVVGCATMLDKPFELVSVDCSPGDELRVTLNGNQATLDDSGRLALDKSRETHFMTMERDGYYPTTRAFNRTIDPVWAIADLIWGPAFPLAWFVDWQSRAGYRIEPKDVHMTLRRRDPE